MTPTAPALYKEGETVLHIPTNTLRHITAVMPAPRQPGHTTSYLLAPHPEGASPTWATDTEVTDP